MKLYRYAFDKDGYYAGLAYPIQTIKDHHIWANNTTDIEPFWKDGFLPRYDLKHNNWVLEPRDEKSHRMQVEKEILSKLQEHIDQRFDSLKDYLFEAHKDILEIQSQISWIEEKQASIIPIFDNKYFHLERKLNNLEDRLFNRIDSIEKILKVVQETNLSALTIFEQKPPTFWERFKNFFTGSTR